MIRVVDNVAHWIDAVRRSDEEAEERLAKYNTRLDKIIRELDAVDSLWWLEYREAPGITRATLHGVKENGTYNTGEDYILGRKRAIVSQVIIPAMSACIRAGFVTPTKELM